MLLSRSIPGGALNRDNLIAKSPHRSTLGAGLNTTLPLTVTRNATVSAANRAARWYRQVCVDLDVWTSPAADPILPVSSMHVPYDTIRAVLICMRQCCFHLLAPVLFPSACVRRMGGHLCNASALLSLTTGAITLLLHARSHDMQPVQRPVNMPFTGSPPLVRVSQEQLSGINQFVFGSILPVHR